MQPKRNSATRASKLVHLLILTIILGLVSPSIVAAKPIFKLPTNRKIVALTFDDYPRPGLTEKIIKILSDENVTATFFLEGKGISAYPAQARYIRDHHFPIGNHTDDHPCLPRITDRKIVDEVSTARQCARNILGIDTIPFFRPPYGSVDARVLADLNRASYSQVIQWNIDTIDWRGNTSPADIIHRVESGLRPGSIILMHISGDNTVKALPVIIKHIKSKGYTFTDIPRYYGKPQPQQYVKGLPDVLYFNWYYQPISDLVYDNVITGFPNGTFKPLAYISRAEFVSLLVKAENIPPETSYSGVFTDVPKSHWAWPYIEAAVKRGIISGYPNGEFRPQAAIARQEIAKIEVLTGDYQANTAQARFSDVPESLWSYKYVVTAKNNGVISGYTDSSFRPAQLANRAEAAKVIWFMLQKQMDVQRSTSGVMVVRSEPSSDFFSRFFSDDSGLSIFYSGLQSTYLNPLDR